MPEPSGLKFARTHEWIRQAGQESTIGISDFAQSQLGDVIYVELPAVGQRLEGGARFGVIESVKAASDLYAPATGEVAAVNEDLKEHPEYVNQDPYGKGWIVKLKQAAPQSELMDGSAYQAFVESEQH
jgi:glycine cleavage system H protein